MTMPVRIQRQRTKGWKMPPNTIYVGRPTKWGNTYRVGQQYVTGTPTDEALLAKGPHIPLARLMHPVRDAAHAVDLYRTQWEIALRQSPTTTRAALAELRGHNLACWCPLDQPCHADVLLELANR